MEDTAYRYQIVKRKVEQDEAALVRRYINDNEVTGVYLEPDTKRYYPAGTLAAQVLGFVGSDNTGLDGIEAVREIDEHVNRLPRSGESYTFHGRDVYAYTGARLASGVISFEGVGPECPVDSLVSLPIVEPYLDGQAACGTIDVLDVRFGSLWTNIPRTLFLQTGIQYGDRVSITIENDTRTVYRNIILFAKSFADVYVGEALAYVNSLDCVAVAINQGSFARAYNIGTGNSWRIRIEPFKGF